MDPERLDGKRVLMAGAVLALGSIAYRSWKIKGDQLFDVSIWGEKTKLVIGELMDDTKKISGRISGQLVLGENGQVEDIINHETELSGPQQEAWNEALEEDYGWSGQTSE